MSLNNVTILIICISVIGVLCLFYNQETALTTIIGGLIGFLAKDQVVLEEIDVDDSDGA